MAKIMLVEDDNNLREIYEARLVADGYEVVSAQDGEEGLATAIKEKPDLIIADIMMPKISGFDMLDILRSTPETKDTKVIMMTALSQAEDKERATSLGADSYLVKSQVTLEDVARTAREMLEGSASGAPAATADASATATTPDPAAATPAPAADTTAAATPDPVTDDAPAPATPAADSVQQEEATVQAQINNFAHVQDAPAPAADPSPPSAIDATLPPPAPTSADPAADQRSSVSVSTESSSAVNSKDEEPQTSVHTKVISPINDMDSAGPDLQALAAKEEAKEVAENPAAAQVIVGDVSKKDKKDDTPSVDPNSISL